MSACKRRSTAYGQFLPVDGPLGIRTRWASPFQIFEFWNTRSDEITEIYTQSACRAISLRRNEKRRIVLANLRIRERNKRLYMVRTQYSADAKRGVDTGLGSIPSGTRPGDLEAVVERRKGYPLTEIERAELVVILAARNPPRDPFDRGAYWLKRMIEEAAGLPLRERQAKIRQVRHLWKRLSGLAGTKATRASQG